MSSLLNFPKSNREGLISDADHEQLYPSDPGKTKVDEDLLHTYEFDPAT